MRFVLVWVVLLSCGGFQIVSAAQETFIITTTIADPDAATPTTPVLQTAVPVSGSQIDLTWSSSTDDFAVGGYQVFRDASFIATTTQISYSDTGLNASTSYAYVVRAFDTSFNYSSTSNSLSTSTLPAVPPPATSTPTTTQQNQQGTLLPRAELEDFSITTNRESATLRFETSMYTRYVLRWGRTTAYELGYVSTDVLSKEHQTRIDSLEPGTTYSYELLAYDQARRETVLRRSEFTTAALPDRTPPANVRNLSAIVDGRGVRLSWQIPESETIDKVRIVRNRQFYPVDPYDGFIVYEGSRSSFFDREAFIHQEHQYYTVFTYDAAGNISSGAVVYVERTVGVTSAPIEISTSTPAEPSGFDFSIIDLQVYQGDVQIQAATSGTFALLGDMPIVLSIPYERLPEHLKTITVTFAHPDGLREFSFLLRINQDKTAYEATIAPLGVGGVYGLHVSIFDFTTAELTTVSGELAVTPAEVAVEDVWEEKIGVAWYRILFVLSLLTIVIIVLLWLLVRRSRAEDSMPSE